MKSSYLQFNNIDVRKPNIFSRCSRCGQEFRAELHAGEKLDDVLLKVRNEYNAHECTGAGTQRSTSSDFTIDQPGFERNADVTSVDSRSCISRCGGRGTGVRLGFRELLRSVQYVRPRGRESGPSRS
jgi:hypothetical protein